MFKVIRTNLRWLVFSIDDPKYMFYENESFVKSTSREESTLYKETSINFLALRYRVHISLMVEGFEGARGD